MEDDLAHLLEDVEVGDDVCLQLFHRRQALARLERETEPLGEGERVFFTRLRNMRLDNEEKKRRREERITKHTNKMWPEAKAKIVCPERSKSMSIDAGMIRASLGEAYFGKRKEKCVRTERTTRPRKIYPRTRKKALERHTSMRSLIFSIP